MVNQFDELSLEQKVQLIGAFLLQFQFQSMTENDRTIEDFVRNRGKDFANKTSKLQKKYLNALIREAMK